MIKQDLRRWAKCEREKLDIESLSLVLVKKLQMTVEYQQAKNIMIFYPLKHEVNLLSLLNDKTKNFYLPKIEGKNLLCCPFKEGEKLSDSSFKTKEPLTEAVEKDLIDLVIVPALAVDKKNYRLGYGGGFYDRFFAEAQNVTKFVCTSQTLVVESVYPEIHDIQMDKIIVA